MFSLSTLKLSKKQETLINVTSTLIKYIITIGISFFLSPYIVKVLGSEANGFVNLSNNFISYFSIVIVALNGMATRFIAIEYHKGNMQKANEYYSSLFVGDLILVVAFSIVSGIIIWRLQYILDIPLQMVQDVKLLFSIIFVNYLITVLITIWNCATYITNRIYLESIRNVQYAIIRVLVIIVLFHFFSPKVYFLGIAIFAGQTVINIYNMYYKYRLVPQLHVSLKMVKKDAIKDLLSSGVWNAFSRAGGLLETGLDLLLSNVLLDANTMGILSVSKSMPGIVNELNYSLANVFLPSMVRDYAKEDKKAIVSSIKSSAKILSVICSIPLCYLIVFGKEFYSLWQPTLDAKLLQELSVLTCLSYVFITGATSLLNIFTAYNKVKQNSLSVIIMGVLSLILTIVFVKITNLGVFAIAGISSVLNILRFLVFVIPYSAKCLNEKWYTFYSIVFQSVVTVALSSLCGLVLKRFIICDTWVKLIFMAFLFCIISFITTIFVVLNKNERKSFMLLFQNLLNKIR